MSNLKINMNSIEDVKKYCSDDEGKLLGTVSDGDLRRAILQDHDLDRPLKGVYNTDPLAATGKIPAPIYFFV